MNNGKESHLSHFNLKIGKPGSGKASTQAPPEVLNDVLEFTIENSVDLPDVCTLRLHDGGFHWLDGDTFREGTPIEIHGGDESKPELGEIFRGEVTSVEVDLAREGAVTLVIRCYDRSHRLQRGRHSRSFVQMTDTDIVKKVGAEDQFTVHAENTPQVHPWVLQNNQTNWEFLTERAARNGFRLYVQGDRDLYFKKVKETGEGSVKLEWGKDLRSFRPRAAAARQVDSVTVRGWDPKTKKAILGRATKPSGVPKIGEKAHGGEVARNVYGGAAMVVVDRPVHSQREADDMARSICDSLGGQFVEAEGLCYARPELRPGMVVEIPNIGKRFSGRYYLTSTVHTYTPAEGYTTIFSVNGKRPFNLLSLLEQHGGGTRAGLGGNIVVGVVTDNKDPENMGRVKIKYPWLTEDHTSFWARQASPMAGSGRGFYFLPEVDDEVLVAFEHGEISRPYVIGALWNGKDACVEGNDKAVSGGKVNRRTIKTRIGHTILLDDTGGKGEMSLTSKDGRVVVLDDGKQSIRLSDKAGNKVTINTSDNSISLECLGNLSVTAKGKVTIKGTAGIDVQSPAVVTVQGSLVKIN